MSRFEEIVEEAIDEVVLGEAFKAETLAAHIAERVRDRQDGAARRGDDHRALPAGQERAGVGHADAVHVLADRHRRRVRARHAPAGRRAGAGHDRVPVRAGGAVAGRARERLAADGFSEDEIERIFEHVPVATHNQRGLGTLYVGCPESCESPIEASAAARDRRGVDVARRSTS